MGVSPGDRASEYVRSMLRELEQTADEIVAVAQEEAWEQVEATRVRSRELAQERIARLAEISEALTEEADAVSAQLRALSAAVDAVREELLDEADDDEPQRSAARAAPASRDDSASAPREPRPRRNPAESARERRARLQAKLMELGLPAEGRDSDAPEEGGHRARGLSLHERFTIDDPEPEHSRPRPA